ncbi:MAG: hypothetical protein ACK5XN_10550 [Bacteroidota bacterium]|jgi:hypothetical protein
MGKSLGSPSQPDSMQGNMLYDVPYTTASTVSGRAGTTNNNSVVNVNINSAKGNETDLQSMAQYLMLRKSFNF